MKSILRAILIALICPLTLFAQSNYKPGYVVSTHGDTIKGFIDYKEWNTNPEQVSFKNNLAGEKEQVFDIKNAKAFAVDGFEYYERHNVKVSMDSLDMNAANNHPRADTLPRNIFLRVIEKGEHLALYRYTDYLKKRFYIAETNGSQEPEELAFHARFDRLELTAMVYNRRYRAQLLYIAQKYKPDDRKLQRIISNAAYNEDDLAAGVRGINGTTDSKYEHAVTSGTRWFAGPMVNYNSFKYKGDLLLSGAPASTSVSPQINAGIDIFPYKAVQKLYFRVELGFSYRQFSLNHREEFSTPTGATVILDVKQYNAILSPQLVYNLYNTEKLKVFIDAGVAINKSFYNDYKLITKYDSFSPNVLDRYPNFSSLWITFPVKAGVAVGKRVEVYFNYMPSKIISDSKTAAFFGTLSSYGAGLNYYFGGK